MSRQRAPKPSPIKRIFVANRGEIAVRIISTCRKLGIETVSGASEPDMDTVPARLANRALCIGPARSTASYLRPETIAAAALGSGCDAVHPGYGFLSENAAFSRLCEENGLIFIGPTPEQIEAVGDKLSARRIAQAAQLSVVPGGNVTTYEDAKALAHSLGYPVLIKAVGGGGGRGMKQVRHAGELQDALSLAMTEAETAFGDARIYMERFVQVGRHVEVQVMGDGARVVHIGTRDCSIQRRYQKMIEEAPAPGLAAELRAAMEDAACMFASYLGYRGAGTVEFLLDVEKGQFYFLEMNARIQVEHPVTEAIAGLDLVEQQIRIAEGNPIALRQEDIKFTGHAIECRLNAEDISRDFNPSPGRLSQVQWPCGEGIRIDTFVEQGSLISPFYDSMIAKVIAHGATRQAAIDRLKAALQSTILDGIPTNIELHLAILQDPEFCSGPVDTGYLPRFLSHARAGTHKEQSSG